MIRKHVIDREIRIRRTSSSQAVNKEQVHTATYVEKPDIQVTGNQLDLNFENAKNSISCQFVGQKSATAELFIAFKRPFVAGTQKDKPKNTFFITGGESCGKHSLVNSVIMALQQEKLLNYNTVAQVDLSLYPTPSEKDVFLSDLYKALYANSDVIVFDHSGVCGRDDNLSLFFS